MPGARYGAGPLTGTGQLSLPDQKPVGAWRAGSVRGCAVAAARPGPVAGEAVTRGVVAGGSADGVVAVQAVARSAAAQPPTASHDRLIVPPRRLRATNPAYLMTRLRRGWLGALPRE